MLYGRRANRIKRTVVTFKFDPFHGKIKRFRRRTDDNILLMGPYESFTTTAEFIFSRDPPVPDATNRNYQVDTSYSVYARRVKTRIIYIFVVQRDLLLLFT